MSTMIAEVYEALVAAGAPEDKAKAAARAIAEYDTRFHKLEGDLLVIKWMLGLVLAGVVSLVLRQLF